MADDVRISTALPRHPKTVKLRRRLQEQGCWALLCLLLWVADNRPDGDLSGMTDEDIEIAGDWCGDAGKFVATLAEVGFLDGLNLNYRIHDWAEHNPWVVARTARVAAAKQAANRRWERERQHKGMQGACEAHTERMRHQQNGNAHHTTTPHTTEENTLSELENSSDTDTSTLNKKEVRPPSEGAYQLAGVLKSEILRNKPDTKITARREKSWAVTADRMLRLDGRKHEEVVDLIRWAQRDEFWAANVLSMETLRAKFDQLQMKSGQHKRKAAFTPSNVVIDATPDAPNPTMQAVISSWHEKTDSTGRDGDE